jgi:hypothetical protein
MNADAEARLTAALGYAGRGWRVLPACGPTDDGECNLRQPQHLGRAAHSRGAGGQHDQGAPATTARLHPNATTRR